MEIVNKTVRHKIFGKGKISELRDNMLTVRFESSVKKFIFPDVFREHLVLNEKQSKQYVARILAEIDEAKKSQRKKEMLESEKKKLLNSLPLHANSQAAFGFFYNEKETVAKSWSVSVGQFRSGYNRGKPRVPSRVNPNSACLLTFREKNDPEANRYIWGIFMVKEDFIGSECTSGVIPAHDKYRVLLTEEDKNKFLFWKYLSTNSEDKSIKWGSIELKYFSNLTMANILQDILAAKRGTAQQQLCEDFIDYFCQRNKINKNQLTIKNKPIIKKK